MVMRRDISDIIIRSTRQLLHDSIIYINKREISSWEVDGSKRHAARIKNFAPQKEGGPPPVTLASSSRWTTTVNNRFRALHSVYNMWQHRRWDDWSCSVNSRGL